MRPSSSPLSSLPLLADADSCPRSKLDQKIKETTFIHQLFGGRLRSRVHCLACEHNSDTFDSILDVSLDLAGGRATSLKDALENLVRKDKLTGQNKYKCEKCVPSLSPSSPSLPGAP